MLSGAVTISEMFLPEYDAEMGNTKKVLSRVPDGKWDWKPHLKSMSLGVLSGHVADMTEWGCDTMTTDSLNLRAGDYKPFIPQSPSELVEHFDSGVAKLRDLLAGADDAAFQKLWSMTWNGQKVIEMPRIAAVRGMVLNHMIHHRGQLSVYLRLLDVAVPGVYGPSADEM